MPPLLCTACSGSPPARFAPGPRAKLLPLASVMAVLAPPKIVLSLIAVASMVVEPAAALLTASAFCRFSVRVCCPTGVALRPRNGASRFSTLTFATVVLAVCAAAGPASAAAAMAAVAERRPKLFPNAMMQLMSATFPSPDRRLAYG